MIEQWWRELDDQVLACLAQYGPMSPEGLAKRLDLPDGAALSLLCMLAQEGRVAIRAVECRPEAVPRHARIA
jgi:predicted ArsR family transcriptional regulator